MTATNQPFTLVYTPTMTFQIGTFGFALQSSWNGIEEWQDSKGRKLLVIREVDVFSKMFGGLFGDTGAPQKLKVIGGAPDLLRELLAEAMPVPQAKTEGES